MWFANIKEANRKARANPEFLVYVDDDDPQLGDYKRHCDELKNIDISFIVGKPRRAARAIKYLSSIARHEFIIFGTDDLDWRTVGWDEKLIGKMPQHMLSVVYPASIAGNQIKARIPFFTKKWRDLTGLFPDDFIHYGADGYVVKIAELAGVEIFAYDIEILHTKLEDATSIRARINGTDNWREIIKSKMPEIQQSVSKITAAIRAFSTKP